SASRDRYRHEVERLAQGSRAPEQEIARRTVDLARAATVDRERHVGFYLVDDGCPTLELAVGYRGRLGERIRGGILRHPTAFYLGAICALSAGLMAVPLLRAGQAGVPGWLLVLMALLTALP